MHAVLLETLLCCPSRGGFSNSLHLTVAKLGTYSSGFSIFIPGHIILVSCTELAFSSETQSHEKNVNGLIHPPTHPSPLPALGKQSSHSLAETASLLCLFLTPTAHQALFRAWTLEFHGNKTGGSLALKGLTFVGLERESDYKVTNNGQNECQREKHHGVKKPGKGWGREGEGELQRLSTAKNK